MSAGKDSTVLRLPKKTKTKQNREVILNVYSIYFWSMLRGNEIPEDLGGSRINYVHLCLDPYAQRSPDLARTFNFPTVH